MSKRILAFICTLAILMGLLPVISLAETAYTLDTYLVGYAKRDINPWVDPNDHSQGILPVYLTGNGNDSERACTGMMDDNGDGKIDKNDGLFTTCTAVTDANDTTVLYITLDTLQGDSDLISHIRNSVIKKMGANVVNGNQIIISGSHTHSGPNIQNTKKCLLTYKEVNEQGEVEVKTKPYFNYICDQVADAAAAAYADRAPARMKRGSVDATTATAAMGYNGGNGYQMNFLRHFQVTAKYSSQWGSYFNDTVTYVVGSSFSTGSTTVDKAAAFTDYKVTAVDHVAEADNTMHLLQFEFVGEDSNKAPVVFVNWRAHPTTNSSSKGDTTYKVSSDYVNSLRYHMEQKGYRAAFFQGAGANTVISSSRYVDWTAECPTPGKADTNTYGELLFNVAEYGLKNYMTDNLLCGDIRVIQRTFKGEMQPDSEGLQAVVETITDENGNINEDTIFPYTGTYNNKQYIVNSIFHAEQVNRRRDRAADGDVDFTTQEVAVVSLGNSATFVIAPNELSDRYGIRSYADTNNDWAMLNNEDTYGTPFVITHANGSNGYLPNSLNYAYNANVKDRWNNQLPLGAGSYEANTSRYASGTGEILINTFDQMLAELDSEEGKKYCKACKADVVWKPVSYLQYKDNCLGSGHYYFTEDTSNAMKTVHAGEYLCLDLNGKNITTSGRSFSVNKANEKDACGILNIFDSVGTGSITSTNAANSPTNGTLNIHGNVNIYGGTYKFNHDTSVNAGVCRGGVVGIEDNGTLHMYGGTIEGNNNLVLGTASSDNGVGAAIYVSTGVVHLHGDAKVLSGAVPEGGFGPCIALSNNASAKVYVYDNAYVDDIYLRTKNSSNLTISGTFTGNAGLSYASNVALSTGMTIGNVADNADVSNATFRLPETVKDWMVYVDGTNLKIKGYQASTVAVIGGNEYDSLQAAVNASTENSVIKLVKAVSGEATTTVAKNVYLNLNGYSITEAVTVNSGYTLYCMDSQTDDYTVEDEAGYGKLTNVSGNVEGIPEESTLAEDGYLKVTEGTDEKPEYSFHRVNLQLTAISLRAVEKGVCAPSVYYKSNFKGDQKVAEAVERYGIALSVQEMPNTDNMDSKCEYSKFDIFAAGPTGNAANGTLLYGIMKPTNKALINSRNANMAIYGRAYIQTADGYVFGAGYSPNLKQVVESADALYSNSSVSDAVKENIMKNLLQMYNAYSSVMKSWNLPNLKNTNKNDGALKVLVIGNSHGLDATNLLYEVFKDQDYTEQNLVLGALYKAGCTMKEHADYMTNSKPNYDYYENDGSNADGSWTVTKDTVADTALNAHQWDIIILQQMNNWAACSTYQKTEFTTVINYVKNHQVGNSRFGWHMVWTNPDQEEYLTESSSLSHPDNATWVNYHVRNFPSASDNTKYDQSVMYQNMIKYTQTYIDGDKSFLGSDVFDFVIPSCTAIEYAQDGLGYEQAQIYRDYTHMSDYGRLMVAYLWYAKILGKTSISNVGIFEIPSALHHAHSAYPSDLQITAEMRNDIKTAVNYALANPYELP